MEMPPLPQACDITPVSWSNLYSADQLREYGESCARMAREDAAKLCEELANKDSCTVARDLAFRECAAAIRKG